jgi:hypothetical protein
MTDIGRFINRERSLSGRIHSQVLASKKFNQKSVVKSEALLSLLSAGCESFCRVRGHGCESVRTVIAWDGVYAENSGRLKGLRW